MKKINQMTRAGLVGALISGGASAADPVAQWSFDNPEMPTSSSANNGLNAALESVSGGFDGALWGQFTRPFNNTSIAASPAEGGLVYFDSSGAGNDPHLISAFVPPSGGADRSFAFWMRSAGAQPHSGFLMSYGANSNGQRFSIRTIGGNLRVEIEGDGIEGTANGVNLEDGEWHHVAVTLTDRDGDDLAELGDLRLYVDGAEVSGLPANASVIDTTHNTGNGRLVFGNNMHAIPTSGFLGSLDEVLIFDQALSAQEVLDLFNVAGSPPAGRKDLVWTGAAADDNFFNEANWDQDPNTDGTQPADPDTLDPSNGIFANLTYDGPDLTLSGLGLDGSSLSILGGDLTLSSGGVNSLTSANSSVSIGGGSLTATFLAQVSVTLTGTGEMTLSGAGNPLNNSTVNFVTPSNAKLNFTGETVQSVTSEHLSKISVDGAPAVLGENLTLTLVEGVAVVELLVTDSDNDSMDDIWEDLNFQTLDRDGTQDFDNDGLSDLDEFLAGTLPKVQDSDGDGIFDGAEVTAGLDPLSSDTDKDGLSDLVETNTGIFVSRTDTGTDPLNKNTDGDRIADGAEVFRGFDPLDANSFPELPNVILILADDLGYGELEAYGQDKIVTPRLKQMADEGMIFTDFYCGSAVCAPTRAMLMTGKHAGRAYIRNNGEVGNGYQTPLKPGTETIATMLKQAGYATSAIGKWGMGGPGTTGHPNEQGFDHFFGYLGQVQAHHYYPSYQWRNNERVYLSPSLASANGGTLEVPGASNETGFNDKSLSLGSKANNGNVHSHDLQTKEAMDWIQAHSDEAFFMYLAYPIPHVSVQAPGHIDDLTDADGLVFENDRGGNAGRTSVDEFYPIDPATGLRPFGAPISHPGSGNYSPTDDKRHEYAAMISAMDRDIGRIVDQLETLGLAEDTLILFTSDNGPWGQNEVDRNFFGSTGGLRGGKTNIYEGGIREPFIAWWPGKVPAGQVSGLVGHHDDLMATIAELTETRYAADTTGRSILPTLLGRPDEQIPRDTFYWEFSSSGGWSRAVRHGDWKLHRVIDKNTGAVRLLELFDLANDPAESTNIASQNPSIVEELERLMDASHEPAELSRFFRPTDEFPVRSGVTVSHSGSGFNLSGSGYVSVPMIQDLSGELGFKLSLNRGTSFSFGAGSDPAAHVVINTAGDEFTITYGGQRASIPYSASAPEFTEIEVTYNPANGLVSADFAGAPLSLLLGSGPSVIDSLSYGISGGTESFVPATVCLPLNTPGALIRVGQLGETRFELSYERLSDGKNYRYETSSDLHSERWVPVVPLIDQALNRFGSQQEVTTQFLRDPSEPTRFYRVIVED